MKPLTLDLDLCKSDLGKPHLWVRITSYFLMLAGVGAGWLMLLVPEMSAPFAGVMFVSLFVSLGFSHAANAIQSLDASRRDLARQLAAQDERIRHLEAQIVTTPTPDKHAA